MRATTDRDCASCHNDSAVMQASAELGAKLPATHFHLNPKIVNFSGARPVIPQMPRPPQGYTATFASFSEGHPEWELHRQKVRDPDTLRFNHRLHLTSSRIPLTRTGAKLDCNYCHKQEPDGRYSSALVSRRTARSVTRCSST